MLDTFNNSHQYFFRRILLAFLFFFFGSQRYCIFSALNKYYYYYIIIGFSHLGAYFLRMREHGWPTITHGVFETYSCFGVE